MPSSWMPTSLLGGGGGGGRRGGGGGGLSRKCPLDELLSKVEMIEKECLVDERSQEHMLDKLGQVKDEFNRIKGGIYIYMEECRSLIRERQEIVRLSGNSVDSIERGVKINGSLKRMEQDFRRLVEVYTRQCRQRTKLELSDEELEERYKAINMVKRQIEECRATSRLFGGRGGAGEDVGGVEETFKTLTELRTEKLDGGEGEGRVVVTWEDEKAEDVEVIERWRERDAEFDKHIAEIGDAVDRIGEVAVTIGDKAEVQGQMAEELQLQTDDAANELKIVNNALRTVIKKQKSATCCCRVVLAVILLGLVLLVVTLVKNRF
eukprot:GHVS01090921.1.p1 GENE.GHVS01090921.1~~GHVS01090921.1.p1  ORF type:complete len:321 (-),score=88.57 GHVS01090921.1:497-1459(-)